jgi:hypothetical protein
MSKLDAGVNYGSQRPGCPPASQPTGQHRASDRRGRDRRRRSTEHSTLVIGFRKPPHYPNEVRFEIVGRVTRMETIAVGRGIRDLDRLRDWYGNGRWRKVKGVAMVRLPDGRASLAEIHWYEANGVGTREVKVKRLLTKPS